MPLRWRGKELGGELYEANGWGLCWVCGDAVKVGEVEVLLRTEAVSEKWEGAVDIMGVGWDEEAFCAARWTG